MTAASSSQTIQKELDSVGGKEIGRTDDCILWQLGDGRKVIETNGDPVWEGKDGFDELVATFNKPLWWTTEDGGEGRPYLVNWFKDGCVESKKFDDEDEASEWGHANLGNRVTYREDAKG